MKSFRSSLKDSLPASIATFACAIVMALLSSLAFGLLEGRGALPYVYATSGTGTILEQMCEIFTGPSVVAFVAIGGIIGGVVAALFGAAGWRFAKSLVGCGLKPPGHQASAASPSAQNHPASPGHQASAASPSAQTHPASPGRPASPGHPASPGRPALMAQFAVFALWAAVAVVIIIGVFAFVFLATISDVQLASVTSKLGGKPGSSSGVVVPAILTLLMLWTLLLEGGSLVFAAVSAASRSRKKALVLAVFLIAATALSGTLMVFLSVELFSRFNVVEIDYSLLNGLLGICVAANLVVMAGGLCLGRLFTSRK